MNNRFDLLIAGAGLVGAAAAVLLAQNPRGRNLKIALLEARPFSGLPPAGSFDPRVVAVTEATRQLLEKTGAWKAIVGQRYCPYTRMSVRDGEGTGLIEFDCADVHQSNLGHIVENSIALTALLDVVDRLDNIEMRCPARIVGVEGFDNGNVDLDQVNRGGTGARAAADRSPVQIRLASGEYLETDLLVAADGAGSQIRTMAGFRLRSWEYRHRAIVTTIRTAMPHGYTARQWFMASGPLAFLPLREVDGDCHQISIVWSQEEAEARRLMTLNEDAFCRELTRASEFALGEVESVAERFSIPLVQRHAVDYVLPGIALVGDAAHSIHPLAGQGVNLGIQDIAVLVEEVCRGLGRGLSPGDISCLRRYQRRRKPENLAMMAAMEAFKGLFSQKLPAIRILRNEGMSRVNRLLPLKNLMIRRAMGL